MKETQNCKKLDTQKEEDEGQVISERDTDSTERNRETEGQTDILSK